MYFGAIVLTDLVYELWIADGVRVRAVVRFNLARFSMRVLDIQDTVRESKNWVTGGKPYLWLLQQFILYKTHTINQKETDIEKNLEIICKPPKSQLNITTKIIGKG